MERPNPHPSHAVCCLSYGSPPGRAGRTWLGTPAAECRVLTCMVHLPFAVPSLGTDLAIDSVGSCPRARCVWRVFPQDAARYLEDVLAMDPYDADAAAALDGCLQDLALLRR